MDFPIPGFVEVELYDPVAPGKKAYIRASDILRVQEKYESVSRDGAICNPHVEITIGSAGVGVSTIKTMEKLLTIMCRIQEAS